MAKVRGRGGTSRARRHARTGAALTALVLAAGTTVGLSAPPAGSGILPEDRPGLSAYTYWRHGGFDCQLAKIPDVPDGGDIEAIGPHYSQLTDGCPDDLAVRERDIDDEGEIEKIFAVIDPCDPAAVCDAPPPDNEKGEAGAEGGPASALGTLNSFLVTIDPETGVRTTIGALGFGSNSGMLTFDDDGRLLYYAASSDPACPAGAGSTPTAAHQCLYELDPQTGAATLIAVGPAALTTTGVRRTLVGGGFTDCDGHVYATVFTSSPPVREGLFRVNTTTAALTPLEHDYGAGVVMTALGNDPTDETWGIGFFPRTPFVFPFFKDYTWEIDHDTGEAEHVDDQINILHDQDTLFGLEFNGDPCQDPADEVPVSVPEAVVGEPTFTG
ncbi:MAG TPA: hypothetical protein VIH82_02135 [Acidimicrobiia bacterium]